MKFITIRHSNWPFEEVGPISLLWPRIARNVTSLWIKRYDKVMIDTYAGEQSDDTEILVYVEQP